MSDRDRGTTRRKVLGMVAALPLAGCVGDGGDDDDVTPAGPPPLPEGPIEAGTVDGISNNTLRPIAGQPLAIGRDVDGFWALGTTCTHLGCNIANAELGGDVNFNAIRCGCHGSQYGRDGDVQRGPSVRDLPNYAVIIEADGRVIVDPSIEVPTRTRSAVS